MFRFIKNLFSRSEAPSNEAAGTSSKAASQAVPPAPPLPPASRAAPKSAPLVGAPGDSFKVGVGAMLSGVGDELRPKLSPHQARHLNVPMSRVIPQLSSGAITVTLGELRPLTPDVLGDISLRDDYPIILPLSEVLPQIPPSFYTQRQGQRTIEVPEEVSGLFSEKRVGKVTISRAPASERAPSPAPKAAAPAPPPPQVSPKPAAQAPAAPAASPAAHPLTAKAAPPVPANAPASVPPAPMALPKAPAPSVPVSGASLPPQSMLRGTALPAQARSPLPPGAPAAAPVRPVQPLPPAPAAKAPMPGVQLPRPMPTVPVATPKAPAPALPSVPPPGRPAPASPATPLPKLTMAGAPPPPAPSAAAPVASSMAESVRGETVGVPLSALISSWPDEAKKFLSVADAATAQMMLPMRELEQGLKSGLVHFPLAVVCKWMNPPLPVAPSAPLSEMTLELPLSIVAPLFMARYRPASAQRSTEIDQEIPEVFGRSSKYTRSSESVVGSSDRPKSAPVVGAEQTGERPKSAPAVGGNLPAERPKSVPSVGPSWADRPKSVPSVGPSWADRPKSVPMVGASRAGDALIDIDAVLGPPGRRFTARDIVLNTAKQPGATGALLAMTDGLVVTSAVPPHVKGEVVAAFLPQMFGRMNQYARELNMGGLRSLTFTVEGGSWQVIKESNIFFAVLCRPDKTLPVSQLSAIALELNQQQH